LALLLGLGLALPRAATAGGARRRLCLPWVGRPPQPPVITIERPTGDCSVGAYVVEMAGSVVSAHPLTAGPALMVQASSQTASFYLQTDRLGAFVQRVPLFAGQNRVTITAESAQGAARRELGVRCTLPAPDLLICLTWDTPADLDLHLVRPGGEYEGVPDDCFWFNPHPDWGVPKDRRDDPELIIEDRDGYGPECIVLPRPAAGTYSLYVYHYPGSGNEPPARATLSIWYLGYEYRVGPFSVAEGDEPSWMPLEIAPGSMPLRSPSGPLPHRPLADRLGRWLTGGRSTPRISKAEVSFGRDLRLADAEAEWR